MNSLLNDLEAMAKVIGVTREKAEDLASKAMWNGETDVRGELQLLRRSD